MQINSSNRRFTPYEIMFFSAFLKGENLPDDIKNFILMKNFKNKF